MMKFDLIFSYIDAFDSDRTFNAILKIIKNCYAVRNADCACSRTLEN